MAAATKTRIARTGTITPAYEGWVTMVDAKAVYDAAVKCTTKADAARLRAGALGLLARIGSGAEDALEVSNGKTALVLIDACALLGVAVEMSELDIRRVAK